MPIATISNNGRITIPAAIRRKYGWNGGAKGVIALFSNGFVFSFSSEKPAKAVRLDLMRRSPSKGWTLPEPTPLGEFRAKVENWRELANE